MTIAMSIDLSTAILKSHILKPAVTSNLTNKPRILDVYTVAQCQLQSSLALKDTVEDYTGP